MTLNLNTSTSNGFATQVANKKLIEYYLGPQNLEVEVKVSNGLILLAFGIFS